MLVIDLNWCQYQLLRLNPPHESRRRPNTHSSQRRSPLNPMGYPQPPQRCSGTRSQAQAQSVRGNDMEESNGNPVGGSVVSGVPEYWWWATASAAQLTWASSIYRKGYAGDSRLMPFKAFAVASLFIGAAATASVASLRASGIESVEDMKLVGANIRTGLGIHPRARNE